MTDVVKKKIISLEPVPGATENLSLMWIPVTKLIASAGTTRKTYRMPYPHGTDQAVSLNDDGELAVLVDQDTIKIVDNRLVGARQVDVMDGGGLRRDEDYELSVVVDTDTIDINDDGELYCKAPVKPGVGIEVSEDSTISVSVSPNGGLVFKNKKLAVSVDKTSGLYLTDSGELAMKVASGCGLTLNDNGELQFQFDSEHIKIVDGKIAVYNYGTAADLDVAGEADEPSDDTVWTSATTKKKIDEAVASISGDVSYADTSSTSSFAIVAGVGPKALPLKDSTVHSGIVVSGNVVSVPEKVKCVSINMQIAITCKDYLKNAYEIPIRFSASTDSSTAYTATTERSYVVDTTEEITLIDYNVSLIHTDWTKFAIKVERDASSDYEETGVSMTADYKMTITGV